MKYRDAAAPRTITGVWYCSAMLNASTVRASAFRTASTSSGGAWAVSMTSISTTSTSTTSPSAGFAAGAGAAAPAAGFVACACQACAYPPSGQARRQAAIHRSPRTETAGQPASPDIRDAAVPRMDFP